MVFLLALGLVVAIFSFMFALQNTVQVTVSVFGWRYAGSLAIVLLGTFALGAITGWLTMLPSLLRKTFALTGLKRKMTRMQEQGAQPQPQETAEDDKVVE